MNNQKHSLSPILLNVPNLIGHVRLLLLFNFVAFDSYDKLSPYSCISMLTAAIALDVVDGKVARSLGQTSKFGHHYDIILDVMHPLVVYGQVRHSPILKLFAGLVAFTAMCWAMLTMGTTTISWKIDQGQVHYWPARAITRGGHFTMFGELMWYFGYAVPFVVIYALDRGIFPYMYSNPILPFVFIFSCLNQVSILEHIHFLVKKLIAIE